MKFRALGVNLLVMGASLLVLLGVLEVAARIVLPRPETVLVDHPKREANPQMGEKAVYSVRGLGGMTLFEMTDTGLRLRRNVRVITRGHDLTGRNAEVRTNSLGYRGDDVPPKTDRDFRILTLGDSITLADYAPEDETYPAHIEHRLRRFTQATKDIRVINAGTSSIDLRTEFLILMETGLSVKPDIVVEGLYLNDADTSFTLRAVTYPSYIRWSRFLTYLMSRTDYLHTLLRYREREQDRKEERSQFEATHPVSATADWHEGGPGFNREIVTAFNDWGYAWTDDAWRKMDETLTLMKQVADDNNFELFVVLLPVRQQVQAKVLRDEPQQAFERSMRRLGLPHLDVLGPMREKFAKDGQNIFYDHCHYRPEGNELIGRLIADALAGESKRLAAIGIDGRHALEPSASAPTARPVGSPRVPEILNLPDGIAVTAGGEVLIADANEGTIERAGPDGTFRTSFGTTAYKVPNAVAVDAQGIVYVADTWSHRVVRLSPEGALLGELSVPSGFYAPRDVAVARGGDVFVANTGRSRIERYDSSQRHVTGWGEHGSADGQFQEPLGVAVGGHELYVADYGNARIQVFNFDGRFLRSWPVAAWKGASISNRPALVVDGDRVYVSDPVGDAVLVFSTRGEARPSLKSPELKGPTGLALSNDGMLYVANVGTGAIARIRLSGRTASATFERFAPHTLRPAGRPAS